MIQRDQADLSRGKLLIKSCGKALQGWEHTFWFSFLNRRLLGREIARNAWIGKDERC